MEKTKKINISPNIFLSVVIPAFNEESVILNTLKSVEQFLSTQGYRYEILVANDGSQDSTLSIANEYAKNSKGVRVLNLPHRGKASTVIDGMKNAAGEMVLFTDADNATPIHEVKKLLHYVQSEGYDIAIGSREGTGAVRHNEPFIRHLMGRTYNMLIKIILFNGIEDTQCGFKLFTQESVNKIVPKLKMFGDSKEIKVASVAAAFDVEVLFIAKKQGLKIKPVPVEWTYGENTKVNKLRDSWVTFVDIFKVWLNAKKGKYN